MTQFQVKYKTHTLFRLTFYTIVAGYYAIIRYFGLLIIFENLEMFSVLHVSFDLDLFQIKKKLKYP